MTLTRTLTTTALAIIAAPALADVTADRIWSDWQSLIEGYGAKLTVAGEEMSGDTLTVSGISAAFDFPEGNLSLNLGDIRFTERSDGSVAISMDDELPMQMDITDPDGGSGSVSFKFEQPGASVVASGGDGNLRYDYDYPRIAMSDFSIQAPDVPEEFSFEVNLGIDQLQGYIDLMDDAVRTYDGASTISGMDFEMVFQSDDPAEGAGSVRLNMQDLRQRTVGSVGTFNANMSAAEMIQSGLSQSGTATHGPVTYEIDFSMPDGNFQMAAAAMSGTINGSFDENGLAYGGVSNDVTLTIAGSQLPLPPVSFRIAESGGQILIPMVPSEELQKFALSVDLKGLAIDDMIWGMIDPTGQLPRDPATLTIDVGGEVIISDDFTDPEFAEEAEEIPGTIETLSLNGFELSIAGASLTGDGDFTFNNELGMPMPSGIANMMLVGGNGLMDKLVEMGLLPEEQAMGARMMLGLFARPGDGVDTLVSTIEVKEDGSILANGQRIK